ncbi:methionine ABC transporter ATP-binding protein [Meridianimarinicoccus roseus]|jgi:putative ABC transport system ATP-binding protein|uniref:Methionine ABC transporter ATP-binding protein n=1 Tax=Meridianimarinicoccus roseus TaxID=2072018 RepID=A0A2V2LJP6_9RHOB|nr:ATP-binding cassette domain-containing protein [Meridianimarinicoccus roseus]PWR04311.1 methionine ABC transporter ATP-binding protein [Meridianimarinicoccus roseus]
MTDAALTLSDVRFTWPGRGGFTLSCPDFRLAQGERLLLLGPSGSGKSTFLSLACGIVTADAGKVSVGGTDLGALRSGARDGFRAEHFGLIFQQFNLLPYASVADNILLPLRFAPARRARATNAGAGGARAEAARLCAALTLPDGVMAMPAGRLSVGQQQRVAVARALIGQPPLIVADEPTSALDAAAQDVFLGLLFDQAATAGSSLLMVSHDDRLGARFDRVLRLDEIAATARGVAA